MFITLIYPMLIDTISLQVNFMQDKILHAYRGCNIRVKVVNLQIKSQILSFLKEVVHYKFSYKIWI